MKKTVRTLALISVAGLMATGCQKENIVLTEPSAIENAIVQSVCYSVNGIPGQASLANDSDWDAFLDRMMALARQGYNVVIYSGNRTVGASTKEIVTFTTTDEDEAKQWAKDMTNQGYDVQISYEPKTGIWTCIAMI